MRELSIPRSERIRRLMNRCWRPRVLRTLALGLTDPANDAHWQFIAKRGTQLYLDDPQPWLAPGADALILDLVEPGSRVFEWGAGSSTLWFLSHGLLPTSYEPDAWWAEEIRRRGRGRVDVQIQPRDGNDYASPDLAGYALVLIDGDRRNECALHAAENGRDGQVIAFDDAHRAEYRDGAQALSQRAEQQWHLPGLSPMLTPKLTSIFQL